MEIAAQIAYLFENTYTLKVVRTFVDLLIQLLPYVLSGIFLSTVLTCFLPKEIIARFFNRHGLISIVAATVMGVLSPLGTYAVIPFIAGLMRTGKFPQGPLVAFLIASPLINPLLFMMTMGAFGLPMAILRVSAAVILGFAGGYIFLFMEKGKDTLPAQKIPDQPGHRGFLVELYRMSLFIFKVFLLSLFVASLFSALVPPNLVAKYMGGNSFFSVFAAVMLGIPLYACGGGSIPIMQVLGELGMSKGAILAFFISGPATKLSTLTALFACLGRRVIIVYITITLVGAMAFGLIYNLF